MNASASRSDAPPLPRILLLEDDPVSAAFLASALEALPARVAVAGSLADARGQADGCDLWLFDAHLPDGDGASLLAELRARGLRTPALAHTAEARREPLDALIAVGFDEVLRKPLSVAALQAGVRRALADAGGSPRPPEASTDFAAACGKPVIWDDATALRALNGQREHVVAMRELFLQELPASAVRIIDAAHRNDEATVRAEVHRLQASCGFVGAARIASTVDGLRAYPDDADALARFEGAVQDTLASSPALSDDTASLA